MPRAVVGNVPASVGADHLRPDALGWQMFNSGSRAERKNVGVLQQEQIVVATAFVQPSLKRPRLLVTHLAQPADAELASPARRGNRAI